MYSVVHHNQAYHSEIKAVLPLLISSFFGEVIPLVIALNQLGG